MWADFTGLAFDQIYNQAAKMSYMFGGQARLPITIRVAMGSGLSAAAQHSGTLYSIYTHLPGIKVVVPSTPLRRQGAPARVDLRRRPRALLRAPQALRGAGPSARGAVSHPARRRRGPAQRQRRDDRRHRRDGRPRARGGRALAADGHDAEVIDPRTLSPLDEDTIVASVEKTGALVVVDESPPRCSVASEIAAVVGEKAFDFLNGPCAG